MKRLKYLKYQRLPQKRWETDEKLHDMFYDNLVRRNVPRHVIVARLRGYFRSRFKV